MSAFQQKKVVVMGGGTGSFTILQAIRDEPYVLTSLVNMIDDGGSTGILRDELGVLPPGDVRQCLVALSSSPKLRELFSYRFEQGGMAGHSLGNIFLTALEKVTGSFAEAVETASEVLNIRGRVVPITLNNAHLIMTHASGAQVRGEHSIDVGHFSGPGLRPNLSLEPQATINPDALQAILTADVVVIGPGDVYTSLGPLLIVDGVAAALKQTGAKIIYLCNLVVKPGHTDGFDVADHAAEIERFIGSPVLSYVVYNDIDPKHELLEPYLRNKEYPVAINIDSLAAAHYYAVGRPLIAGQVVAANVHDRLADQRSLIRHDGAALAAVLREIV